jgi:hypothetical protein
MLSADVPSYSIVPLTFPSEPRTVETIMWRTLKCAPLWALSTDHVFEPVD